MMIKIVVFKFDSDGSQRSLYCQSVDLSDSLKFDYDEVYKVLRLLYPGSDGVDFCVM